jgi:hypothetical protein
LKLWLSSIAFGNQTISSAKIRPKKFWDFIRRETHGFASLPHGKFAFIVYNRRLRKELCRANHFRVAQQHLH